MGISFIGLGVSLAVVVIIAVVIYLCCCRKRKSSSASDRVINPAGQGVRSDNLIANRDDPGYPTGPPGPTYPMPGPASGGAPVGWNIDQASDGPGSVPYPHDDGGSTATPGSGWGPQNPSAPPPPYPPPPYPQ
ncbi:expressed protein [Echinococcus multilocularis]|uniref:Expressed protein n=1 Tax=Echinococcus multilocularis TaxID=6211 RepID=A0A068Y796_ECHMU|nr:expressed protein [Echinococcus multilocularis]